MSKFGILNDGQYGIESWLKVIAAANAIYDLFAAVYLDDKKFGPDDWLDIIGMGPGVAQKVITAANAGGMLGKEGADLSENEKSQLVAAAGARFKKPGYQKLLKGILDIVDGIAELKNPDNPATALV